MLDTHNADNAPVPADSGRRSSPQKRRFRHLKGGGGTSAVLWIGPSYLVIGAIFAFPLVWNVIRSFYTTSYGRSSFVGLANYRQILQGGEFYSSLLLTLYWTAAVFVGQFALGLALALFFNQKLWVSRFVKPLMVLPWAIPGIVSATAWTFLYSQGGLVDKLLSPFLTTAPAWLASTRLAMPAVIVAGIWKGAPFYFLMFLAGLQTVPDELLEAARLDGANRWQVLTQVKLPAVRNIVAVTSVLGLIWTANYFDGIYLMTGGGPVNATQTLPIWIYNAAFSDFNLSEASALSVILLILVLAISIPYLVRRRSSYAV